MKGLLLAVAAILLAVAAVPNAAAASRDTGFDEYVVWNAAGGLGGANIQTTLSVAYTPSLPSQAATTVGINAQSNNAQAGTVAIAVAGSSLTGCTVGTLTTTAGNTFGDTERLPLTLTGADCHGTVEITLTQGATLFGRINARISIVNHDLALTGTLAATVSDDVNGWNIHQDQACGTTTPCAQNTELQRFWLELVFFTIVFVGACMMGWKWVAGFAIPWFPHVLVGDVWPLDMQWAVPFLFLGVVLEWASQGWRLRKNRKVGAKAPAE